MVSNPQLMNKQERVPKSPSQITDSSLWRVGGTNPRRLLTLQRLGYRARGQNGLRQSVMLIGEFVWRLGVGNQE